MKKMAWEEGPQILAWCAFLKAENVELRFLVISELDDGEIAMELIRSTQ